MPKMKCPRCFFALTWPAERAGRKARCPSCSAVVLLPQADSGDDADAPESPPELRRKSILMRPLRLPAAATVGVEMGCAVLVMAFGLALALWLAQDEGIGVSSGVLIGIIGFAIFGRGVAGFTRARGVGLRQRMVELGQVRGRTQVEIVRAAGKPQAVSRAGGVEVCSWQAPGYLIALTFEGGICQGVQHDSVG